MNDKIQLGIIIIVFFFWYMKLCVTLYLIVKLCFLKLSDGLNAIPMTEREKHDCSTVLSPQQLRLVDIGKFICNSKLKQPSIQV